MAAARKKTVKKSAAAKKRAPAKKKVVKKKLLKAKAVGAGRKDKAKAYKPPGVKKMRSVGKAAEGGPGPIVRFLDMLGLPQQLVAINTRRFESPEALLSHGVMFFRKCAIEKIPPTWHGLCAGIGVTSTYMRNLINGEDQEYATAAQQLLDIVQGWAELSLYMPFQDRGAKAHLEHLTNASKKQEGEDKGQRRYAVLYPESDRWSQYKQKQITKQPIEEAEIVSSDSGGNSSTPAGEST